jgi:hypothetical protein
MTLASPVLWEISRGRRRFRPCSRRIRRRLSESNYFGKCSKLYEYRIWIDDDVVQKIRFDRDPRDPVCDD